MADIFRYKDGVLPNLLALCFIVVGYPLGVWLLTNEQLVLNGLGFVLTFLTLVWSAYFIHEFAHQAIFKTPKANGRWGTLMSWINGSCYATFEAMRK